MENPIIIFGADALGAVALDIFKRNGVVVYGFLDDDTKRHNTEIGDVMILGSTDDDGFLKLIGQKCEACVAIDDRTVRRKTVKMLNERRHIQPVNAIHDTAVVSELADIGHGNLIAARVVINAKAKLGQHCVIQSGAIIEAGAIIGDFVNIGAGAVVGAAATLADGAFVGAGATIVGGIGIGKDASIGAGSVVIADVASKIRVFGNPAKEV